MKQNRTLKIEKPEELIFGKAIYPVKTRRGLVIGNGTVFPELNFTLSSIGVNKDNLKTIKEIYSSAVDEACKRACDLALDGLVIEFETLIEMTLYPNFAIEITKVINEVLEDYYVNHKLKSVLRITPNDTRHKVRPPFMRSGQLVENMFKTFEGCANEGAELLSIESTGGKEIHDDALLSCDLEKVFFALIIMGTRDMTFLWKQIVSIAKKSGSIASGDTACGFANTAMVLAEKKYIPRVFAALVRAVSIVRSLVAYDQGAVGPGKDCGYENPYLKAITGYPMSMEGKVAACAHSSPLGNIAASTCDLWSNESVQNIRLLGGMAPTVCLEQLIYDCRLMNQAARNGFAIEYRNLMVDSDRALDPQALILSPENVIRIAQSIIKEEGYYHQAKAAAISALNIICEAYKDRSVCIPKSEETWIDRLGNTLMNFPEREDVFIEHVLPELDESKYRRQDYQL
jgi:methanol--5-hydroxybenzimidazolylcobamide Co-methyltransferase